MRTLSSYAFLLVTFAACGTSSGTPDMVSESTSPPTATPTPSRTAIVITAQDAVAHGLPALGVSVDLAGTPMELSRFPEAGWYLTASGPPGGLILLRLGAHRGAATDAAFTAIVQTELGDRPGFASGAAVELTLAGAVRSARLYTTNDSGMREAWLAALVPDGDLAVVVLAGLAIGSADEPSAATFTGDASLGPILGSFLVLR